MVAQTARLYRSIPSACQYLAASLGLKRFLAPSMSKATVRDRSDALLAKLKLTDVQFVREPATGRTVPKFGSEDARL